jgi:hypothetical protein
MCALYVLIIWEICSIVVYFVFCVVSTKLAKRGRGNTETSCMGCNPAMPACSSGCQKLIDKLYQNCDEACLPYGYYFDPHKK